MKKTVYLLLLAASIVSCKKEIPESVSEADYYVNNKTGNILLVKAKKGTNEILLSDSIVAGNSIEKIYGVVSGTGGHTNPSNFFTQFEVFVRLSKEDSLIYTGVINDDWESNSTNNLIKLTLKIE